MRKLSELELQIIAGGNQVLTRVTVTGPAAPPPPDPFEGMPENEGGGSDEGGGGGGGEPPPEEPELPCTCPHTPEELEKAVDGQANKIAQQMRALPDINQKEYLAFVYRAPDGSIATSRLVGGDHPDRVDSAKIIALRNEIGGIGAIIATIHNHPAAIDADSGDRDLSHKVNTMPSDNDWQTNAGSFGNGTLYILDSKLQLREFEAEDRAKWELANNERNVERRFQPGPVLEPSLPPPPPCPKHKGG
jgi:hypothetical protein